MGKIEIKDEEEVKEKKVKNKVKTSAIGGGIKIGEAIAEIGGEVLQITEVDAQKQGEEKLDPAAEKQQKQLQTKEKRISQMKKMVLLKKMQAVRSGAGADITASYEPEGEMVENLTSLKATTYGMPHEKRKAILDKYRKSEKNRGTDTKKGRDAGAIARERLNKEDLDKYDRYNRMILHKQDKYGKNIIGADYNLENERKAKGLVYLFLVVKEFL